MRPTERIDPARRRSPATAWLAAVVLSVLASVSLASCRSGPEDGEYFEEDEFTDEPIGGTGSGGLSIGPDDAAGVEGTGSPLDGGAVPRDRPREQLPRRPARREPPGTSREVRDFLERLAHPDPAVSEKAFWELAEVDQELIPELISRVDSDAPSTVTRLRILVKDETFEGYLASRIPGMGPMEEYEETEDGYRIFSKEYDDKIACNVAPNRRGIDVRLKKAAGFPIGIVLRAALLNRFRSSRYPSAIDHTRELKRWWRAYYDRVFH